MSRIIVVLLLFVVAVPVVAENLQDPLVQMRLAIQAELESDHQERMLEARAERQAAQEEAQQRRAPVHSSAAQHPSRAWFVFKVLSLSLLSAYCFYRAARA